MSHLRLSLLLGALVFGTAACGGASSKSNATSGHPELDANRARFVSLQQSDLPASFQGSPQDLSAVVQSAGRSVYADCLHKRYPADRASADVNSLHYGQGLAEAAASNVIVSRTSVQAKQDFATIASPSFAVCSQTGFPRSFAATAPAGATATGFQVVREAPPIATPQAVAYRFTAVIHRGPISIPLTIDRVYVLRGRTELTLTFNNVGSPFPPSLETQVVGKVLARM